MPKKNQNFKLNHQVKRLKDLEKTLQKNLLNAQEESPSNFIKVLNDKDVSNREACLVRESPIYYALRTKHSLMG